MSYSNLDQLLWGPLRPVLDAAGQGDARAAAYIEQLRQRYGAASRYTPAPRPEMPSYMRIDAQTGLPEAGAAHQRFMTDVYNPMLGKAKASQANFGYGNSFAQQRTNDVATALNKEASNVYENAKNDSIRQHMMQQKDWLSSNANQMDDPEYSATAQQISSYMPPPPKPQSELLPKVFGAIRGADNLLGNAPSNMVRRGGQALGGRLNRLFFGDPNQTANYFGGW